MNAFKQDSKKYFAARHLMNAFVKDFVNVFFVNAFVNACVNALRMRLKTPSSPPQKRKEITADDGEMSARERRSIKRGKRAVASTADSGEEDYDSSDGGNDHDGPGPGKG